MAGYSFGIEEEYFLTERSRGGVRAEMPPRFVKDLAKQLGREQVTHELLQSQIEVCTRPATASQAAREQLMAMRSLIADLLTLSRLESPHAEENRQPVNFSALIEQAAAANKGSN